MRVRSTRWFLSFLPSFLLCAAPDREGTTLRAWDEYRVIMWVGESPGRHPEKMPLFAQRLRDMGVDTAMVHGGSASPGALLANHFPYYVENVVNRGLCLKWNSKVRDWDAMVTQWAKDGRQENAFVREFCFDDRVWRQWAEEEMRAAARKHGIHQPLAYDIRDELSVTISANPFDYDYSPAAIEGFRSWLKGQYMSLSALNGEWETRFADWDEVWPFSTDRIKNRMASGEALPRGSPDWRSLQQLKFDIAVARRESTRWNFAPWADFRTYMDVSLARTLAGLRRAARDIDPHTPVGIEGTQMPHAFGGYDLWRLSQVLDWVEPYDICNAREILGSFMPGRPILSTVFESEERAARRRLWHLLLEGDRGCIVWWSEDCIDWRSDSCSLTPKARALTPVLRQLKSPLARLFLLAKRERDPIYIHYSQPSIQANWLIESTVDGSTWFRRFSSHEADHNRQARVRNAWIKALQDLGWSPQFISADQLVQQAPDSDEPRVLVLPQSWAMSDREIAAVESLLREPATATRLRPARIVLAASTPGLFNEHGRLRPQSPLERLFAVSAKATPCARTGMAGSTTQLDIDLTEFPRERLKEQPNGAFWKWLTDQVKQGPVKLPPEARVRVHRFRAGEALLVAFERNVDYQMNEDLRQNGGNQALEKPVELTAQVSEAAWPRHLYDLDSGSYMGEVDRWSFALNPWRPALFALLPNKVPQEQVVEMLINWAMESDPVKTVHSSRPGPG